MIPKRLAPVVFGLILSGIMSCLVSGISTLKSVGFEPGLFALWMNAWAFSWAVAFPTVLVVAPVARRFVARHTRDEDQASRH